MYFALKLFATALLATGYGARISRKRSNASSGQPGQVDEVFNIGGPAVFASPIENPRGGGCFPGIRMWTQRSKWYGLEVDYAPFLTVPLGFHHALQEGMEINRNDETTLIRRACSSTQSRWPTGIPVDIHAAGGDYIDPTQNENDHWYQVLNVGVRNHHNHNVDSVRASAAQHGWAHVHSAFDEGGDLIIGRQVSHLFRHPGTRECIVTFQGAGGWQDGLGHTLVVPVDFCGLRTKVHMGFRDGLRHVLNNSDWQANIRSQFPTCSKVYAAGHSLGGMKATLFAACANQILQPGDDGYDSDYRYITWATEQGAASTTEQSQPVQPAAPPAPRLLPLSKMQPVRAGEPGQVDEVFNIGGPAVFTSPIENPRGGGCFPGIRQWTVRQNWWGWEADYAPFLTLPFGFHHAFQDGMEIHRGDETTLSFSPCSDSNHNRPWGFPADIHSAGSDYIDPTQNYSDHWYQVLNVGVRNHHNHNIDSVKARAAAHGWEHVHSSFDEGGDVIIGRQVSHLFRQPETHECIVTFQGADGIKDGLGHPLIIPVEFCGLPTWVHMGFRDGLRHVLNNSDWQANIRSQFPTCSKVIAAGHSLGGMKATLFAACANQLLQPGDDGYDSDYRYITWTAQPLPTPAPTPGPTPAPVQKTCTDTRRNPCTAHPIDWYQPSCSSEHGSGYVGIDWEYCSAVFGGRYICQRTWTCTQNSGAADCCR